MKINYYWRKNKEEKHTEKREYEHTFEYKWNRMFSPMQRFGMYTVMTLWVIWGIMGFTLVVTDATLQGYAFAKEVWADYQAPNDGYVKEIVVEAAEEPAVIMERISKCESGGKQFNSNGTLVKRVNKDGSIDFGKFQINDKRHEAQAAKLGMNIYTEEGNEAYAYHLYNTQGTEPWYPSKNCWRK